MLKVTNLTKKYNSLVALDRLSFSIKSGEVMGLLGPNGCGKTTTIGIILGLIEQSSGNVFIDNEKLTRKNRSKILNKVNFASPYVELPKRLTVSQNLRIYARLYNVKKINDKVNQLIEELELQEIANKLTGELSSGQRTKVSIAKSLINNPKLLLLDEPTASLDLYISDMMRSYLENYKRNNKVSILIASHNMQEVDRLCNKVIMLNRGKIIESGTTKEIISKYDGFSLEKAFLKILTKVT